ncbi:MAG: hypothetical protein ACO21C_06585 [Burkholderiaceae bacterium]
MSEVMKLAGQARRWILVVWLCMVIGPLAQAFDLVWLPPSMLQDWLGQDQVLLAYQSLWQSVHQAIDALGDYGLMPLGYGRWAEDGVPVLFVFVCVALIALLIAVVTMTALAMDLRGVEAHLTITGSEPVASSTLGPSAKGAPQYRAVTRAVIDSIESNLQACESGLEESTAKLEQARQTVLNLSLDPNGPRSEQDLTLLREQLDQVRSSLERQRGPQHAMMANLSKF